MRGRVIAGALAATLSLAPFAGASCWAGGDTRKDAADQLSNTAYDRYQLGLWDEAISLWTESYKEYPNPDVLFDLGQAYRQLKSYERAVFYYRAYLRDKPDAANRADVEDLIVELEKIIEVEKTTSKRPPQDVKGPKGALRADGTSDGAPVAAARDEAWWQDRWGWGLTAGGVIVAGVGGWLLYDAHDLDGQADGLPDPLGTDAMHLRSQASDRRSIGTWTLVGGGALIVAGVVKLAIAPTHHHAASEESPTVVVGLGYLGIAGRF